MAGMQPPDDRRTSVLLADDDERFRSLVRELLEDDGYAVVAEAASAEGAVRCAVEARPEVVVLDLVMPRVEGGAPTECGLDAAGQIAELLPGARLVILSSLFDGRAHRAAEELGAGYVEKVAGIDALEHAIEALVRR